MSQKQLKPDTMDVYFEEAYAMLDVMDLQNRMLILEDQYDGEVVSQMLMGGGPEEYTLVTKEFDSDTEWEKTVDRTEAAEIIAGWSVVGRIWDDGTEATR